MHQQIHLDEQSIPRLDLNNHPCRYLCSLNDQCEKSSLILLLPVLKIHKHRLRNLFYYLQSHLHLYHDIAMVLMENHLFELRHRFDYRPIHLYQYHATELDFLGNHLFLLHQMFDYRPNHHNLNLAIELALKEKRLSHYKLSSFHLRLNNYPRPYQGNHSDLKMRFQL